jgi:hypothetical protein
MLEALKEHEDQMEDLGVSMQEGYVEVGLKDRENDAIKGPDAAVWGPDESRPKVPMPESAGKHIHVQIEGRQVTITETPFLDIARELHGRRITPEDAWQRLLDESA